MSEKWTSFVICPNAFTELYTTEPSLDHVELLAVSLSTSHGQDVHLTLVIDKLPDLPAPRRWPKTYDNLLFAISFYGARRCKVYDWPPKSAVSIVFSRIDDTYLKVVCNDSEAILVELEASVSQIGSITPQVST